ncbi:MAG: type II toxin-antitoxin system HipA family toxin [Albidovulum sp.]|nr:type II toxin-antitoxin system HipA family toxin [Albidovulum sp.]
MRRRIQVRLGVKARLVGELVHENDGRREHSVFCYAPEWQTAPDAFAISPQLPVDRAVFHLTRQGDREAIPAVMMDGGPDSWGRAVIQSGLGRRCDELDYLLKVDDWLRTGALRYFDEEGAPLAPPRSQRIPRLPEVSHLVEAARRFDADPESYPRNRAEFMQLAGSLGGARPKLCVADEPGDHCIAKLARTSDRLPVAKAEVLALRLAKGVGIRAAKARLMHGEGEHPLALIRRFDRTANKMRLHFMSAQTMLGIDGAAPGDYVSIAEALRSQGCNPAEQMAELFQRLAFTILVSNFDDHLRNHGFIYAGSGRWQLSPAYDINPEPGARGNLKTAISEIHGFRPSIEAALDAAPFFDLDADSAAKCAGTMAVYIRDSWRPLGEKLGMTPAELRLYAPAFEHEEARAALRCHGKVRG